MRALSSPPPSSSVASDACAGAVAWEQLEHRVAALVASAVVGGQRDRVDLALAARNVNSASSSAGKATRARRGRRTARSGVVTSGSYTVSRASSVNSAAGRDSDSTR
jgi:hypothetical protein